MVEQINGQFQVSGRVQLGLVDAFGLPLYKGPWTKNLVMYDWGTIAATRLSFDTQNYQIRAMYLEFENVALPTDPVAAPIFTRAGGVSYYNNLVSSPSRDYLRVAAMPFPLTSSNATNFPLGNVVKFYAQSTGAVGVHGKTFSDTVNSKIFGGALVATKSDNDASGDLVMSRFYFDTADQQVKLPTSEISLTWELTFN